MPVCRAVRSSRRAHICWPSRRRHTCSSNSTSQEVKPQPSGSRHLAAPKRAWPEPRSKPDYRCFAPTSVRPVLRALGTPTINDKRETKTSSPVRFGRSCYRISTEVLDRGLSRCEAIQSARRSEAVSWHQSIRILGEYNCKPRSGWRCYRTSRLCCRATVSCPPTRQRDRFAPVRMYSLAPAAPNRAG